MSDFIPPDYDHPIAKSTPEQMRRARMTLAEQAIAQEAQRDLPAVLEAVGLR